VASYRWKSRLGRPRIPENLRQLIVRMVQENPTWGEERIAAELSVKLGILVSPRTVRAYWPQERDPRGGRRTASQHWRKIRHPTHVPTCKPMEIRGSQAARS
jgi:hypothetical protein